MTKLPLIVIAGATASGKTSLSIDIARRVGGEIVCADSMQIYKYMNIGTAKPTNEERSAAAHHMLDFVDPREKYSVADYAEDAHKCIENIISRGKTPIMCGGTGLYVNSVVNDVEFGETEVDGELRERLRTLAEEKGGDYLIKMLAEFDSVSAARLHANNLKRIIRAIEFYSQTGIPISQHQEETKKKESRYEAVVICIDWDREKLYERINKRVDIMLEAGLYDEVLSLKNMGCTRDMQSMQGIGYREMLDCLDGSITIEEAAELIKRNSRRYAKRQLTWFRNNGNVHWIAPNIDAAMEVIEKSGVLKV